MEDIDEILKRNSRQYMIDSIILSEKSTNSLQIDNCIGEFTPIKKDSNIYRQVKEDKKCKE